MFFYRSLYDYNIFFCQIQSYKEKETENFFRLRVLKKICRRLKNKKLHKIGMPLTHGEGDHEVVERAVGNYKMRILSCIYTKPSLPLVFIN